MRIRSLPRIVAVLLVIGCVDFGPSDPEYLDLSGTVRVYQPDLNGAPIAGATVRVVFRSGGIIPVGNGQLLASTTTRADGTYDVRVPAPPGYAFPNCAVMTVEASAAGFLDESVGIHDPGPDSLSSCEAGRGRADVALIPNPG